jgi:hypothetical protein
MLGTVTDTAQYATILRLIQAVFCYAASDFFTMDQVTW